MIQQQQSVVLWNRRISDTYYRMGLSCPQGYDSAIPGQFVMLQVGSGKDPLLRRPFSIFRLIGPRDQTEGIEVLYKIVGRGTRLLSQIVPNQLINILGPLGHGFVIDPNHRSFFLAAGGIGVAPIRFLADFLLEKGRSPRDCHVFIGGRNRQDLLCRDEFLNLGMAVTLTTDDGTAGDQCLVTDPLEAAAAARPPDIIFACGPHGMLQCLAGIAKKHLIPCQVSIETVMACGMGACLGCAVQPSESANIDRYLHVCVDGPVFDIERIQL